MYHYYSTCIQCGALYPQGMPHSCQPYQSFKVPLTVTPPSLDTNPLFLALIKRIENLEQRLHDLQTNPNENKVATLTYG